MVEGEQPDDFGDLSGGEREQLSLVVRIALADVLRGNGTLPLLFDDSMVNTDSDRIQIVQSLLYRAARNLQIILFTCRAHYLTSWEPTTTTNWNRSAAVER